MGLRGPKPGFRDAQRELTGKIASSGRPRYRKGDGKPFVKLTGAALGAWKRYIAATESSGNIREAAYPLVQEAAQIVAALPRLWDQFHAIAKGPDFDSLNTISLVISRKQDRLIELSAKLGFDVKSYSEMAEAEPKEDGPSRLEVILSGGSSRAS